MGEVTVPVTTTPNSSGGYQILVIADPYTLEEWRAVVTEALAAPAFIRNGALLVDRRAAAPVTAEFVDEMIGILSRHRDALTGARVAVVTSDVATYGMARMTQIKSENRNLEVSIQAFRSYENALMWLVGA